MVRNLPLPPLVIIVITTQDIDVEAWTSKRTKTQQCCITFWIIHTVGWSTVWDEPLDL